MKKLLIIFCIYCTHVTAQPILVWNDLFSIPNYSLKINDAVITNGEDILLLAELSSGPLSDLDPYLIKYTPSGQRSIIWSNIDSTVNEGEGQLITDSLDNIYILTYCLDTAGVAYNRLVKYNTLGDSVEFTLILPGLAVNTVIGIYEGYLYFAVPFTHNLLFKIDFQGNIIWNNPISYFNFLDRILFSSNFIYLIGDSAVGLNFQKKIVRLDFTGQAVGTILLQYGSIFYSDAFCDTGDNIYYTGNSNFHSIYLHIDSAFNIYDTLVPLISRKETLTSNSTGSVYWSYWEGQNVKIVQVEPPSSVISTLDSVAGDYEPDFNFFQDKLYHFHSRLDTQPLDINYRITCMDTSGGIEWEYTLSNDSSSWDLSYQLFNVNGSIYGLGHVLQGTQSSVNVFKLDILTSLPQLVKADDIIIYPNPTQDVVHVKNLNQTGIVELYNSTGRQIVTEKLVNQDLKLNLSVYFPGIYFLVFKNASGEIFRTEKVIKL